MLQDGAFAYNDKQRKYFYGCSSLNLEKYVKITNDEPTIEGRPVKCYHVARGHIKPKFNTLFDPSVVNWFYEKIK